jgi:RHS repeat-associated protein
VKQKFTGQEHDAETQFDFFHARYLSAAQQRFMSPDPGNAGAELASPQSWNAYSYVQNNPLNRTDPTGFCDAFIAGIQMNPGQNSTVDQFSADLVAVFPYAGTGPLSGMADVAFGSADVAAAKQGLLSALAQTPDGQRVNVTTISGGSQAFASAYRQLTPSQQNRIGNVNYLIPGNVEWFTGLPSGSGDTNYVVGTSTDQFVPSGYPRGPHHDVFSNCGHDAACVLREQASLLRNSRTPCASHQIIQQKQPPPIPPPPQLNPGLGGLFDGWNEFDLIRLLFGQQGTVTSTITFH